MKNGFYNKRKEQLINLIEQQNKGKQMKKISSKIKFGIATIITIGSLSVHAATQVKCQEDGPGGYSLMIELPAQLPADGKQTGEGKVTLNDGQILTGGYKAEVVSQVSRLIGETIFEIEVNYAFPDYGLPHTLKFSGVGPVNLYGTLSGLATVYALNGMPIQQLSLDCKVSQGTQINKQVVRLKKGEMKVEYKKLEPSGGHKYVSEIEVFVNGVTIGKDIVVISAGITSPLLEGKKFSGAVSTIPGSDEAQVDSYLSDATTGITYTVDSL
jgi:hypothetical protein